MSIEGKPQLIRVVQAAPDRSGTVLTQGTQVFVGDQEISGIQRIEIVAEVNDVWRARIDCTLTGSIDLQALAVFHKATRWDRLKAWLREALGVQRGP